MSTGSRISSDVICSNGILQFNGKKHTPNCLKTNMKSKTKSGINHKPTTGTAKETIAMRNHKEIVDFNFVAHKRCTV